MCLLRRPLKQCRQVATYFLKEDAITRLRNPTPHLHPRRAILYPTPEQQASYEENHG